MENGGIMAIYRNGELNRTQQSGNANTLLTSDVSVNHGIAVIMQSQIRATTINEIVKKIASINKYELNNDAKMKVIEKILLDPEE